MNIKKITRFVFVILIFSASVHSHSNDKFLRVLSIEKVAAEIVKDVSGVIAIGYCLTALWDYFQLQKVDRYPFYQFSDINECLEYMEDRASAYSGLLSESTIVEWLQFRSQLIKHFNEKFSARSVKWFLFARNLTSQPLVLLHKEITVLYYQLFKFVENDDCNDCGGLLNENISCERCAKLSERIRNVSRLLEVQIRLEKMPQYHNELIESNHAFTSAQVAKGIAALVCGYICFEMGQTQQEIVDLRNSYKA